jgi:glucosamine-6-phosphate deaminase
MVSGMHDAHTFQLQVVPSSADLARAAADRVVEVVTRKPAAAIALPTGSTPLGMFEELVRRIRAGDADFSRVRLFCLDEYLGVSKEDPNSLTGWLFREFVEPAGIAPSRVHTVPSEPINPIAEAAAYEAKLAAAGGLDLAVLGIGGNGHIAFNEPGSPLDSRTRIVDLTPESRRQAAAYWEGTFPAPTRAMTIGIATVLDSAAVVLIAAGEGKAEILRLALLGPVSPAVPASLLRTQPDKLTVILDAAAALDLQPPGAETRSRWT